MYMSNTDSTMKTVEWKHLNWRKLEKAVFKLQKRIYKASLRGDVKATRRLQKTLMKSWYAKCLAVRRVTQDNTGKKTAGVDGVKSLSPAARLKLVDNLKLGSKVRPTRRVWIPKPGSEEKRPLGIPIMYDRALCSRLSNWLWNRNGKQNLNLTHTGSDQVARVMMRLKPYLLASIKRPNTCWMLI